MEERPQDPLAKVGEMCFAGFKVADHWIIILFLQSIYDSLLEFRVCSRVIKIRSTAHPQNFSAFLKSKRTGKRKKDE